MAASACFLAALPLTIKPRRISISPRRAPLPSHRTASIRHPLLLPQPATRTTPKSHNHCGGANAHSRSHSHSEHSPMLLSTLQTQVTRIRESPQIAGLSAALLSLAALFHLTRLALPLIRLPLYLSATLTALPALFSSISHLMSTHGIGINVDVLMTLAALVCLSTGALFEGVLLSVLYAVSHATEHAVQSRARRALDRLRDIAPSIAYRLPAPSLSATPDKVPVANIAVGDFLLVRAGELVPCDGSVADGTAFVSTQILTGEATPRSVGKGELLPAGARPEDAPLVIRVTSVGAESSMARIARLVTAAQENRPRITILFDRYGTLYARAVLLVSAFIAMFLPVLTRVLSPLVSPISFAGRSGSAARALGFLVAASPCALLVGGPVAYIAALSCCARMGVLAKSGARSLEAASRARHVVFDKTGTLTTGKLTLESAVILPNVEFGSVRSMSDSSTNGTAVDKSDILAQLPMRGSSEQSLPHRLDGLQQLNSGELSRVVAAAAALERGAVHPVATAVQERAVQLGGQLPEVTDAKVIAGHGVEGVLSFENGDDLEIACGRLGRPSYVLGKLGSSPFRGVTEEASLRGETISVLEIGTERYLLRMRDQVRQESADVVSSLKEQGLEVSVLTGDGEGAARYVSRAVGGGVKVISNATPEEKLGYVTKLGSDLRREKSGVLMVGDGVNDAAALAAALVGVACGLSSATAVHAADVVLVEEELAKVGWFLRKARATRSIVQQNLVIALGLMALATGACLGGAVPLWLAVTLHEGGTLLVGLNALRLLQEG